MKANQFISEQELKDQPAMRVFLEMFKSYYRYDVNRCGWIDIAYSEGRVRSDGLIDPPLP